MKILCVGDLWTGSTALQRINTIQEIYGCDKIDSTISPKKPLSRYLNWAMVKLRLHPDFDQLNKRILQSIEKKGYDVIWIEKGLRVHPRTLNKIHFLLPACKIISSSPDDMYNPLNQSRWYVRSIPLYNLHVTTKSYNVSELKLLGAKDVLFVDKAFDPRVHKKVELMPDELSKFRCNVGFIGSWERDRYEHILFLARNGIQVTVRGNTWKKYQHEHPNMKIIPKNEWESDYVKVINATKINLCFLKKINRDLQTARSIEIPASGGFMIAERTNEHRRLFGEDSEAVFFTTKQELLDKVRYYLAHEYERQTIAEKGYLKCIEAGYTNANMLKKVFNYILMENDVARQVTY